MQFLLGSDTYVEWGKEYTAAMALVFDIETVGESWDALDETTQHNLSWYLRESSKNDEE